MIPFRLRDLIDPALMPSPFERRLEPELEYLVRQPEGDNPSAHREHVRVVVQTRQPRRVEIVAKRGADTHDLIGRDLLALTAAAEHDTAIGASFGDRLPNRDADRRIVDRVLAVRPVVVHRMAQALQRLPQMFFQQKTGVICADGDSHSGRLYYYGFNPGP